MVLIYLVIAIVCGYYIYGATLGGTFELKSQYEEQLARSESGRDFGLELVAVQQELNKIEKIISAEKTLKGKLQQTIIKKVNNLSVGQGIDVVEVPAPVAYPQAGYDVVTTPLEIEGGYLEMVALIHKLEEQLEEARISAVEYYTRKNAQQNNYKLYARIYFQNIQKK